MTRTGERREDVASSEPPRRRPLAAASDGLREQAYGARWAPREIAVLAVTLAGIFCALQFHLRSVLVSDMDEGTYVFSGLQIARGLVPYRDFMLAHPPLLSELVAIVASPLGSSLIALRVAYLAIVVVGTIPLYALVREVANSKSAALLTVVSYTTGMLLVANMGRTVRLEPLMNAFVIAGVACRYLRPQSWMWSVAAGMLFVAALAVKLVAAIPVAFLIVADVAWERPFRTVAVRWLWIAVGAGLLLVPAVIWCASQSKFVQDVLEGQVHRPRLGIGLRMRYLAQNFVRYPPALLGLAAALFILIRGRDARLRGLAFVAIASTVALVFAFKTFFNYYIVQALPWIVCCFAIACDAAALKWLSPTWRQVALSTLVLVLGIVAPIGYAQIYERTGVAHVAGPRQIISVLKEGDGYVYSMYPAFALWSGRQLYPWYYQTDSLVPRINGWIGDKEFLDVFSGSNALVLFAGELDDYPGSRAYVDDHFTERYRDNDWSLWVRAR